MKRLAIILGAGASYSINPEGRSLDNGNYRPPLTLDLFRDSSAFSPILNKYPKAQVLASSISSQLNRRGNTLGLEQILKTYQERLDKGEDSHITRAFLEIPLYLNDLLGEVSHHFTKQPHEYNVLVSAALDSADEVLFLTLNYDTLLEIALGSYFGVDFSEIVHYIGRTKWALVKLHGSANWYRHFNSYSLGATDRQAYLNGLHNQNLPINLGEDILMYPVPGHQQFFDKHGAPIYPALTVPVDGKYEFNCPPVMIDYVKEFVGGCENYLIIGNAGNDKDLLDLLKENAKGGHTLLVGRDQSSVEAATLKFLRGAPPLSRGFDQYHHAKGFSEFVTSDKFEKYLAQLR